MFRIASLFWLLVCLGVSDGKLFGGVWQIWTRTGDIDHGGSDANVYLHLINADAKNSPPLHLDEPLRNDFERGQYAPYLFVTNTHFEDVCWIRMYRDNLGFSPNLYIDWVRVKTVYMHHHRVFEVYGWVPTEEEERNNNFITERKPPCRAGHLD
ncbi:uncharacterized protein LOC112573934 [Pomacea canaliculata]|uniref:uncharacterized protein LOC112573934 n=1 Tax=Pomacea canaliculata TaxID=400727 RepID=UPI000D734B2C|nr:uncharacterized protein LOC112573934 [Pomacea canaliculata]